MTVPRRTLIRRGSVCGRIYTRWVQARYCSCTWHLAVIGMFLFVMTSMGPRALFYRSVHNDNNAHTQPPHDSVDVHTQHAHDSVDVHTQHAHDSVDVHTQHAHDSVDVHTQSLHGSVRSSNVHTQSLYGSVDGGNKVHTQSLYGSVDGGNKVHTQSLYGSVDGGNIVHTQSLYGSVDGENKVYTQSPHGKKLLPYANVSLVREQTDTRTGRGSSNSFTHTHLPERGQIQAPDVAILMLACNRAEETSFALSAWSRVKGIGSVPLFVSVDCIPGVNINEDFWIAKGLRIRALSSHQRGVTESGEQVHRQDERVTRHWLWAVSRVLSEHDFVLYCEDDHVVLPEILNDMHALLTFAREACPNCFAVQMGCHGDCWGAVTDNASLVGLMEPGNMGVVYSREKWQWFTGHIADFCESYGGWDVNLHLFLQKHTELRYALTFLKTRIQHMTTCRSSRTHMRGDCNWSTVSAGIDGFLQSSGITERIVKTDLRTFPSTASAPRADTDTQARCVSSVVMRAQQNTER